MVLIDFHVNAPDKMHYVCRLARKIRAADKNLVIYSRDAELLETLDRQLWTFSELDFLPHCMAGDALAPVTPIILLGDNDANDNGATPHHEVMVNLDHQAPPLFSRFDRLIEVVTGEQADLEAGRKRWKFYRDRGYELNRHDSASPPKKQHGPQ